MMDDYHDKRFIRALRVAPAERNQEVSVYICGCVVSVRSLPISGLCAWLCGSCGASLVSH